MIFERRLFNKPIAVTVQGMASGTDVPFLTVPFNKLGYLKRIQVGRHCDSVSGCIELNIYDTFDDPLTHDDWPVPGTPVTVKRKAITIPAATLYMNHDETEDIPLIGVVSAQSSVEGIDLTITVRTM